jgi:hypothetical protein
MLWLSEKMNAHLLRYAKKVTRREGEGKEAGRRYADVPDISIIVTSSADCGDQQQRPICLTGSNM